MLRSSRAPERASDAGQVQPDLVQWEGQAGCHLFLVHVEPLGGDVEIHAAVVSRDRQGGLGTHLGLILHACFVTALDNDSPRGLAVARADALTMEHVAERMDRHSFGGSLRVG